MTSAEFLCLTKDSLQTLQSHISLFINNAYEEMKKHTQICMINLLQRYRLANIGGGGLSSASALRDSSYNHSGSSLGTPTINVNDIDWLNEQVETEKKNLMQALNTQIEEWIEHAQDVAEALQNRIVRASRWEIRCWLQYHEQPLILFRFFPFAFCSLFRIPLVVAF